MFTALLLLTGVVLGIFNYRQTTQIILSSSEKLFNRIEQDVRLDLQTTYEPIRHLLNLLADMPATQASALEPRLALLKPFSQSLKDNPDLASLYLGYGNGDFFMVRPLRTAALKTLLKAPDTAAYQVWSIERHGNANQLVAQSLFYDQALNLISRQEVSDETYDPRARAWFTSAHADPDQITTEPYIFFSTHNVGTTLARRSGNGAVMGADLTLAELSATLAKHVVTPSTEIVLFDAQGNAIAYPDASKLIIDDQTARLSKAADLSPGLGALLASSPAGNRLEVEGRQWIFARSSLQEGGSQGLQLALLVPEDELLVDAYRMRWQGALITLATLLLCLPLGWLTSRILVKPLHALVKDADAIRSFDFNFPVSRRSPVLEVDQLSVSMARMKDTLGSFFQISDSLCAETRFAPLLQRVLFETVKIAQAQAGLIYLREGGDRIEPHGLVINGTSQALPSFDIQGHELQNPQNPPWLQQLASTENVVANLGFEQAGDWQKVLLAMETPRVHLIGIRLRNRHNETVGLLVLLLADSGSQSDLEKLRPDRIAFLQAVSGAAAVSIESQRLQAKQKQLLDSFIQLLAGAIDAKSPYTGGHCQRVPALTLMLAQAAAASQAPAFSGYLPTEDEWEALHIAAWLHDCGKVTTPEYVVDKATKLETLNDRIHEIRTRFEVLKRDAWINYWQAIALGGDEQHLAELRNAVLAGLDDDFSFVARCNLAARPWPKPTSSA